MCDFTFDCSKTNVPILSKPLINEIGEKLVEDYCPDALVHPQEIDIDRFISNYLGAELDYQFLSHCGLYLGMTIFENSDYVPVFNPDKWEAEYISAKAGTIIIDNSLLDDSQEHRYRFTAAHEAAHRIVHQDYFKKLSGKSIVPGIMPPMVQCREDTACFRSASSHITEDKDWLEWQANHLASAILMPRRMVIKVAKHASQTRRSVNAGLEAVAEVFNVSNEAAHYRMAELQLR